jgi:type II secretory pathway component PulF
VATLILLSAVILVTVLVPRLIEPLAGEMTLPLPTRILIGLASFLSANWFLCMAGIIAVLVGWRLWLSLPANRLRVDLLKLRAPLVGRLLRDVAVARFTRTLGTLASAGIPILDALRITRDTLGNKAMMQAIDAVQEKVTSGTALAEPLERSGLFPPLLIQVVNLGERSGRLEAMLMHAATAFDRRVNSSIKLFTRTLPPVLIMVMAGLGGFVLAAIMLPLLSLQSVVQ